LTIDLHDPAAVRPSRPSVGAVRGTVDAWPREDHAAAMLVASTVPLRHARSAWLGVVLAATAPACSVPAIVDVPARFNYEVSAMRVTVPQELRDSTTMRVRSIPCMGDANCPQLGGTAPAIRCIESACDPDPVAFALASDVIDLGAQPAVQRYGDHITRVEVRRLGVTAVSQGLQNAVGPTELYWGPDTAPSFDGPGVQRLGTLPVVQLAEGETTMLDADLDPTGVAALSDYLIGTSRRIKIFARPSIDLAPGGPLPMGQVTLQVEMLVHVEGQLVR
jgi:hypothetical protein